MRYQKLFTLTFLSVLLLYGCGKKGSESVRIEKGDHVVLIGNNLASRMMQYGYFESTMHSAFPDEQLTIRNMGDGGNTPGFRPHSGRDSPWAFEGAEAFYDEYANQTGSIGHFKSPDEWLKELQADVILAFFGYSESFQGQEGISNFKEELQAFVDHTLKQTYNGSSSPNLILISPIAFENLSDTYDLPNGEKENENLKSYSEAIKEIANVNSIPFVNAFDFTSNLYESGQYTIDGFQLNEEGYKQLSQFLVSEIFGAPIESLQSVNDAIKKLVLDKNWYWHNYFKIPNGVHVFGRRYDPFGPDNYPFELEKLRNLIANRDTAIWKTLIGEKYDLAVADSKTGELPEVTSNFNEDSYGRGGKYLYGQEALSSIKTAPGYRVELFASEAEFEELANPVQISFDNEGRLWVAVMPSYPHYKPGDSRPNDKLIILEDNDQDGKADKLTTFADNLHLPTGFEIESEGVYVSQGTNLVLLSDTDGDDQADKEEIILSGFDDHDTHHGISAFTVDPSGAIYMAEGVFLHTNVETAYGAIRGSNGGFFRYNPKKRHLERTAQLRIPNPWGIAFDDWGQPFFLETSGPSMRWMLPGTMKPVYGFFTQNYRDLIKEEDHVRPTSGLEFVSSRHFPEEVQGDIILGNTIGFLGIRQHKLTEDETGFQANLNFDLIQSSDPNFRPVDMEFAPDGSLYLADWHNKLIGHMQHNARDPLRDHVHGRIYRITYPGRDLIEPVLIADASIEQLLENLKSPEYRIRYRTRRELRGRDPNKVTEELNQWLNNLDSTDPSFTHHKVEALWVSWGVNRVNQGLLMELLEDSEYFARAAAVRTLRYNTDKVPSHMDLFIQAAADQNAKVRMEVMTAATWLQPDEATRILSVIEAQPLDNWSAPALETAKAHVSGVGLNLEEDDEEEEIPGYLDPALKESYLAGREIYLEDGYCGTCHQESGKGLKLSGFPPLIETKWVLGNDERLIKLTLKGLMGPIEVAGESYPGNVPMTPFEGMLNDEEVANVLTYVRNAFGNKGTPITAMQVQKVRTEIKDRKNFYSPAELLSEHPMEE